MSAWLIRTLCLGCGLLLALPPAWCCYTPQRSPDPKPEPAPTSCCHKNEAPKPAPSRPAPAPCCPCDDRSTVAPPGPEKPAADLSLPAPLSFAFADSPRAGPSADAATTSPLLSRPLHLLQCVWLC